MARTSAEDRAPRAAVRQRCGSSGAYSEEWSSGGERHYTFDALNRLICVGPAAGNCSILNPSYDSQGRRIREYYTNSSGAWVQRRYAGEYFTLQPDGPGDFQIFAFGEQIAYKRKGPVTLRAATSLPGLPWVDLPMPPPVALALLVALGLGGLGILAIRLEWSPGLRDEPTLAVLSLALVVVLVLPPLPARAGGGGTTVNYRRWILGDHLGSATVVLDEHGQAERETVYAPFGAIHDQEGALATGTEVFAGHPLESTTDLHYMQARWQNPETGSFLSVDPLIGSVGDPQAYNGYSYVRGNPVSFTDPTGMGCFLIFGSGCYSGDGWLSGGWGGGSPGGEGSLGGGGFYIGGVGLYTPSVGPGFGGVSVSFDVAQVVPEAKSQGDVGVQVAGGTDATDAEALRRARQLEHGLIIDPRHPLAGTGFGEGTVEHPLTEMLFEETGKAYLEIVPGVFAGPAGRGAGMLARKAVTPGRFLAFTDFTTNFGGGFAAGRQGFAFSPTVDTAAARLGTGVGYAAGAFDRVVGISRAIKALAGVFD